MKGLTFKQFLKWLPIQQLITEGVITKDVITNLAINVTKQNPPISLSFTEFSELGNEMENFLFGDDDYSEEQMNEDFEKVLQQKQSLDEVVTHRMMEKKAKYNLPMDVPAPMSYAKQIEELEKQSELEQELKHPSDGIDDDDDEDDDHEDDGDDKDEEQGDEAAKDRKSIPLPVPTPIPSKAPTPSISEDVPQPPQNVLSDAEFSEIYQEMLDKVTNH